MRLIAITCGDPSGLGPELIELALRQTRREGVVFRVFGPRDWVERVQASSAAPIEGVPLTNERFEAGSPRPSGARLAIEAMEAAASACRYGDCAAVVTGPISKALCAAEGYAFPGQTEFFADRWGGDPTMAFVGERLRLCLATWHVPLRAVPELLTEAVFSKAVRSAATLGQLVGIPEPRILVCGLNPHAGEGGLLGFEERDRYDLWLETLRQSYPLIEGCVPGDTAFARALKGEADIVVALYHDQGLAPFKAVDFDSGVNVTLGLRWLRVSPDHGTGFGIAGKGIASAGSMLHAIALAANARG